MKKSIKSFDYVCFIKYLTIFLVFLVFNQLENEVLPYSTAAFVAALSNGSSLIFTPLIYLLSFLVIGEPGLLGAAAIVAGVFVIIIMVYRRFHIRAKIEIAAYTAVALVGFILIGNTASQIPFDKRILTSILTVILSTFCLIGGKALNEKGLKFKLGYEEFASLALLVAVFGVGLCNLTSPLVWKSISALVLLLSCYVYRRGISTLLSAILGISLAIHYNNLNYVAVFIVWAVTAEGLCPLSRHVAALAILLADYLMEVVFGVYGGYSTADFLSLLVSITAFCIIPNKPLSILKEKLYSFREKQLVRQSINRNRIMLSGRLYDLSGVFTEMANAFTLFNHNEKDENGVKESMEKQIINEVCKECESYSRCMRHSKNVSTGLIKLIDIGFAKGKLSLIDIPKDIGEVCLHPNSILFGINKRLSEYRAYTLEQMNMNNGRALIASEAIGISEILRGLALESGTLLKYHSRLERSLSDALFKDGFLVTELLIYGEEDNVNVGVIIAMTEFSVNGIQRVISKTLGMQMVMTERAEVTDQKCYMHFRKAAEYDAVFGISRATKDGSEKSGDTHSVTRISDDKFLVALSDGMGSGKNAENISSASLSLIESFYKAGLSSPLILNTVNKLLTINNEDSFTALDVSIVNLKDCSADFIKYGSPYGFIVGDNGVKIVEGNSLPLGILEDLKPAVCHTELSGGDMIVLITDGISDAFGSSGEIIDFLRSVPAKNPQTLSDELLDRAINLNGGQKKDDMTALAVRIFKRTSSMPS